MLRLPDVDRSATSLKTAIEEEYQNFLFECTLNDFQSQDIQNNIVQLSQFHVNLTTRLHQLPWRSYNSHHNFDNELFIKIDGNRFQLHKLIEMLKNRQHLPNLERAISPTTIKLIAEVHHHEPQNFIHSEAEQIREALEDYADVILDLPFILRYKIDRMILALNDNDPFHDVYFIAEPENQKRLLKNFSDDFQIVMNEGDLPTRQQHTINKAFASFAAAVLSTTISLIIVSFNLSLIIGVIASALVYSQFGQSKREQCEEKLEKLENAFHSNC